MFRKVLIFICLIVLLTSVNAEIKHGYYPLRTNQEISLLFKHKKYFEEELGEKFTPVLYTSGIVDDIRNGTLASGVPPLTEISALDKRLEIFFTPYLFVDYKTAHKVFDEFLLDYMNNILKNYNLKALGILDRGFMHFLSNEPLKNSKIISHKHCGVHQDTHFSQSLVLSLRCNPSRDFDTIDLSLIDINFYDKTKHYGKYITLTSHVYIFRPFLINLKKFNSLSEERQKKIIKIIKNIEEDQHDFIEDLEDELIEQLEEKGYKFGDADINSYIRSLKPLYNGIDRYLGKGTLFKIQYNISKVKYNL